MKTNLTASALLTISLATLTLTGSAATPIALCKDCEPTNAVVVCKDCEAPNGAPTVAGSAAHPENIVDGWLQGKYPKIESGPYFSGDFNQVKEAAKKDHKLIVMSVGRDACPNTTRFYHYLESGMIDLKPDRIIYLKLNGDNEEHVNLFSTYFENTEVTFPFVGVMNGEGGTFGFRNGYGTSEAFNEFFAKAIDAEKKWREDRAASPVRK